MIKNTIVVSSLEEAIVHAGGSAYPGFYFDADKITNSVHKFKPQPGLKPRGEFMGTVCYAVKANDSREALRAVRAAGITHFDVASPDEMEIAQSVIGAGAVMHYNNPYKDPLLVKFAYDMGVRDFSAGSPEEAERILNAVNGDNKVAISLRLNLNYAHHLGGVGETEKVAFKEYRMGMDLDAAVAAARDLEKAGIRYAVHFHVGSQCTTPLRFETGMVRAEALARVLNKAPAFINVGGGFPATYCSNIHPDYKRYFSVIKTGLKKVADACGADAARIPLLCEPGRALVADSETLIAKVLDVSGREVVLNAGPNSFLQELEMAKGAMNPFVRHYRVENAQAKRTKHVPRYQDGKVSYADYTILGNSCDGLDRLCFEVRLPQTVKAGDMVTFHPMGAYASAFSKQVNSLNHAVRYLKSR